MNKCDKHPNYKGLRKSRFDCSTCHEIYAQNKGKTMETVDQEKIQEAAIEKFTETPPDVIVSNPPETVTTSEPMVEVKVDLQKVNCIPPNALTRNKFGLLENINYIFDENGFINWKAMLRPQDLALNRSKKDELEKKYNKNFSEIDIIKDKVEDKYLLILLGGIRYLAAIRGFAECSFGYNIGEDRADAKCSITFLPSYETNYKEVRFESVAERSKATTVPPFSNFLVSLAENAAFARTVRNFLRIPVLAYDEIMGTKDNGNGQSNEEDSSLSPTSPQFALKTHLDKYNISFTTLKKGAVAKIEDDKPKYPDAEKWESLKDIKPNECLSLITSIKKLKEAKIE